MPTKKLTLKEETLNDLIKMCEKEITRGEIFIGFYTAQQNATENINKKAEIGLKMQQVKDAVAVNTEMLKYFKSL